MFPDGGDLSVTRVVGDILHLLHPTICLGPFRRILLEANWSIPTKALFQELGRK